MEKLYKNVMIITSLFMFVVTSLFFLYSIDVIGDAYVDHAGQMILEDKKNIMRDTVNNLFREIDAERSLQMQLYEGVVFRKAKVLQARLLESKGMSEDRENEMLIDFFRNDKSSIVSEWYLLIWDQKQQKEVYDSHNVLSRENWDGSVMELDKQLTAYRKIIRGDRIIVYSVGRGTIKNAVQKRIINKIRALEFENDSYIWINEVVNYDGGDEYAIRRVHPGQPETEGMYLSTYTPDVKGNYPYLEELEGVKEKGEVFFRYYFQRDSYKEPEEKISYAKLYKDYDWIICMGAYLDDIDEYAELVQKDNKDLIDKLIVARTLMFLLIILGAFGTVFFMNRWLVKRSFRNFENELGRDVLTLAESRRAGQAGLEEDFAYYRKTGNGPMVLVLDIDHFKNINDTYGHDFGDRVLKAVVSEIYNSIRKTDRLVRWGGDEFIGIFYGLKEDNCLAMGQKILKAIEALVLEVEGDQVHLSVSMGFAAFQKGDVDFMDAVKRADAALYDAKQAGRGCARIRIES